ncbi:uncharacterized protein LOC132555094 [Ylistrum balloti]|uniref:uncharacterized protein LOC132555094 n=1 Tax=Ylistrum balloti TaxID=509963 RepID=UPI002905AF25|nr:uncharacterized protein LOC132555094 [Ylistrum balloti]
MPRRYLLAAYVKEEDETPKILSNHTFDVRKKAEDEFLRIANRKVRSTVLYDSQTDEIIKIAIEGEPIFLVKAIELARGVGPNSYLETVKNKVTESAAKNAIESIAKALLGEAVPGISDVVMAHFTGPYYALKGDHVGVAATAGGLWGTVSGAVIGTIAAGPIGGVVGGIIGGSAASMGAGALVKSFEPPKEHKKCDKCDGTGLFRDFRRCPSCKGYGYKIK